MTTGTPGPLAAFAAAVDTVRAKVAGMLGGLEPAPQRNASTTPVVDSAADHEAMLDRLRARYGCGRVRRAMRDAGRDGAVMDEARQLLDLVAVTGMIREHLAAADEAEHRAGEAIARALASVREQSAGTANVVAAIVEQQHQVSQALERYALRLAQQVAGVGPVEMPLPDTDRSPRAHRAMIHARYLARRSVHHASVANFPGTTNVERDRQHALAVALAIAVEHARGTAAELVDTDPLTAAVLDLVADRWHELASQLLTLAGGNSTRGPTRRTRALAPPGRHPLSVAVAAHAPPGGSVCHARPLGRTHALTDPGPP